MYKFKTKFGAVVISGAILMETAVTCLASEVYVTKASVDSNTWTAITNVTKQYNTLDPEVKITDIYKADGSSSQYKKVQIKVSLNGKDLKTRTIEKGSYYTFDIADIDAKKGYTYKFSGMGNDPELDCKVTGYFNAH